jgi:hypothetical protein
VTDIFYCFCGRHVLSEVYLNYFKVREMNEGKKGVRGMTIGRTNKRTGKEIREKGGKKIKVRMFI